MVIQEVSIYRQSIERTIGVIVFIFVMPGCAVYNQYQLDTQYGEEQVRARNIQQAGSTPEFYRDVKPIVDSRCVVCHGCYDAPCQLKLEAFEGLDRGASKDKVYDGERLLAANLSRLFIDASSTQQWREKKFHPVLNEREQTSEANLQGSVLYRMLALKHQQPLPDSKILPDSFDLRLYRNEQCPTVEEFDLFEKQYPLWGMPYAMPALEEGEFFTIERWLASGAKFTAQPPLNSHYRGLIDDWEVFFNGNTYKQRLMSRYIYEHLFTAHLYFETGDSTQENREYFKLFRSTTAPGEPVNIVATRRPYDDPGVDRVYYRLVRVHSTLTAKSHMPYGLDEDKMQYWRQLFLDANYSVTSLPSYKPEVAANPFIAFEDIPVVSRYKFMLDEAHFTIMGFIKGPVCRGQVAINVINDHFWVLFTNPDSTPFQSTAAFLAQQKRHLRLPSEQQSNVFPMENWLRYSITHKRYLQAKREHLDKLLPSNKDITLDLIWDGYGDNPNAALTVFRHFDSASVVQGLVGNTPKTAWVIDYPLLERIHYLLVSGFDVYGNIGHQLETRLYMDFLRMEGEYNFLTLLPMADREREVTHWYRGAESKVKDYIDSMRARDITTLGIDYKTNAPKQELFDRLRARFGKQVIAEDPIHRATDNSYSSNIIKQLALASQISGKSLSYLPEVSLLRVGTGEETDEIFSVIVNRAHSSVSDLFGERNRLIPEEQTLTIAQGIIGAYPNVFLQVAPQDLADYTARVSTLNSEKDYEILLDLYGVRRSSEKFWAYSDWLHRHYQKSQPLEASLLDYNRIENR